MIRAEVRKLCAEAFQAEQRRDQSIDIFEAVVKRQRRAHRGFDAEPAQRGLRAVVARADGDPAQAGAADRARVWVLRDGKPTRVTVVTGLDDDEFTEIVSGELKADDRVIVSEQRQASGTRRVPLPKL